MLANVDPIKLASRVIGNSNKIRYPKVEYEAILFLCTMHFYIFWFCVFFVVAEELAVVAAALATAAAVAVVVVVVVIVVVVVVVVRSTSNCLVENCCHTDN